MSASSTPPSGFANARATWNQRFAGDEFLFGTEPNRWLEEHAGALPAGGRVLCVADGEGRNSVWLAHRGFRVDAFDLSDVGVAKARKLAERQGVPVNYAVADVDALQWPEAVYDAVVAIFVQFASPQVRGRLFEHMQRCLRRGGVLVLQGYTPEQLTYRTGGPPQREHLYTPALLQQSFAKMELVELREYEADVAEGKGHHGRSALIGLVARKR